MRLAACPVEESQRPVRNAIAKDELRAIDAGTLEDHVVLFDDDRTVEVENAGRNLDRAASRLRRGRDGFLKGIGDVMVLEAGEDACINNRVNFGNAPWNPSQTPVGIDSPVRPDDIGIGKTRLILGWDFVGRGPGRSNGRLKRRKVKIGEVARHRHQARMLKLPTTVPSGG